MSARRLSGVIAAAALGAVVFYVAERTPRGCDLPSPPADSEADRVELQEAKNLVREARWVEAREKFQWLLMRSPSYQYPVVSQYLEKCDREITSQAHLVAAQQHFDEERYALAKEELNGIAEHTEAATGRDALEEKLKPIVGQLMREAAGLRSQTRDRAKMERLKTLAETVTTLDPERVAPRELLDEANLALQELTEPWHAVVVAFEGGDVAGALAKARACSRLHQECREHLAALAVLEPKMKKLPKQPTASLLDLLDLADGISPDGQASMTIIEVLRGRYERSAKLCRTAKDWVCVDKQLSLASALHIELDDETLSEDLNAFAKEEVLRAEELRHTDPKRVRAVLRRILALETIDDHWHQLAERVEGRLLAEE